MPRVVPSDVVAAIDRMFEKMVEKPKTFPPIGFDQVPQVIAIAQLVEAVPDELLTLDPGEYAQLIAATAFLRALPDAFQAARSHAVMPLKLSGSDENAMAIIRGAMAVCPDEAPATGTTSLAFITDHELRESIRLDISGANRDLAEGEWKGGTVLAGAAVEALLLWSLQEHEQANAGSLAATAAALLASKTLSQSPDKSLERWGLHEFIAVAEKLRLVCAETATQARLAQNFRNLIHPGRAARLGQKCDRGTALSALAAVELVVRDLTPP